MPSFTNLVLGCFALLLPTASLAVAQAEGATDRNLRSKTFGEVRTASGDPWVGVKVTLSSLPVPEMVASGTPDVVTAITDENGRFRAPVLRHRRYVAWAMGAAGDGGGHRVTRIVEDVTAGERNKLVEAEMRSAKRAFVIVGAEQWKGHAPLRARLIFGNDAVHAVDIPLDSELRGELPPLPVARARLSVMGKNGVPLAQRQLSIRAAKQGVLSVKLPRKRRLHVAIRDIKTQKGIAGATIHRESKGEFVKVGVTAKDGVAAIDYPRPIGGLFQEAFFVTAKGYCASRLQTTHKQMMKRNKWTPLRKGVDVLAYANLSSGETRAVQIRIGGKPAADLALILRGTSVHHETPRNTSVMFYRRLIKTDADGRFEVSGDSAHGYRGASVSAVLSVEHLKQLPESWQRQVGGLIPNLCDFAVAKENELAVVDLSELCPVMVEVVDAAGLPAAGATVWYGSTDTIQYHVAARLDIETDRAGRVGMLMRPGRDGALVVRKGASFLAHGVEVRKKPGDESLTFLRLKLEKPLTIAGKVVSPKGKPTFGVKMTCFMTWSSVAMAREEQPETEQGGAERNSVEVTGLDDQTSRNCFSQFVGYRPAVTTNRKGEFRFEVPNARMSWNVSGSRTFLFMRQRTSQEVEIDGKSITDLELTLK